MRTLDVDLYDGAFRERLEEVLWQACAEALAPGRNGHPRVRLLGPEATATTSLAGRALGAAVELHHLDVPLAELARRCERRAQEGGVAVSREQLERWTSLFEAPTTEEDELFDRPRLA